MFTVHDSAGRPRVSTPDEMTRRTCPSSSGRIGNIGTGNRELGISGPALRTDPKISNSLFYVHCPRFGRPPARLNSRRDDAQNMSQQLRTNREHWNREPRAWNFRTGSKNGSEN